MNVARSVHGTPAGAARLPDGFTMAEVGSKAQMAVLYGQHEKSVHGLWHIQLTRCICADYDKH
ncbi:hypothetical protein LBMAG46_14800 [Planctomycetia bacterium]|nr:hypothetical protein LBMAG46_14800 [Planctomycetia bacterium]